MKHILLALLLFSINACGTPRDSDDGGDALDFDPAKPFHRPYNIALGGGDAIFPGNTLFAFEEARRSYAIDGVYTHVRATKDNTLVLSRNDELLAGPACDGQLISELDYSRIAADCDPAFWFTPDNGLSYPYRSSGQRIITLLDAWKNQQKLLFFTELSGVPNALLEDYAHAVEGLGYADRTIIVSGNDSSLETIHSATPDALLGMGNAELTEFSKLDEAGFNSFATNASYLIAPEKLNGRKIVTKQFVINAHLQRLEVYVIGVSDKAAMQKYIDMAVDGIITSYPDRLAEVLEASSTNSE